MPRTRDASGTAPAQTLQDRLIYRTLATGLDESCSVNAALC